MDLKLLHLMEDFVLKEVDYSQNYGYSGRAKRYMRRKLNNELTMYLDQNEENGDDDPCEDYDNTDTHNESDTDNESIEESNKNYCDYKKIHRRIDVCLGIASFMFVSSIYASIAYIIFSYNQIHMQIQMQIPDLGQLNESNSCLQNYP